MSNFEQRKLKAYVRELVAEAEAWRAAVRDAEKFDQALHDKLGARNPSAE